MAKFLKIENPGVAPEVAFTLLGASVKDASAIGKFGSGNKMSVAVLLRHGIAPVVFTGNLKLEFGTRTQNVDTGLRSKDFERVYVKFGGKDSDGKNRSSTEDLGFTLNYGESDWDDIRMGLREFVSNAIDRAVEEGEHAALGKFLVANPGEYVGSDKADEFLDKYRQTATDFKTVKVEVVDENQVRAKAGTTRVFVPLTDDVADFYTNLGRWFLHFSEPESLRQTILPKRGRNIGDQQMAVIYRRGVRVREFTADSTPSLFDYNLENLDLDESRNVDDWAVQSAAGKALADADEQTLAALFGSFGGEVRWEHRFTGYSLKPQWNDRQEAITARAKRWERALVGLHGENTVLATKGNGEVAARKGFKVIEVPEAVKEAAAAYGLKTPEKVLSPDETEGREILPPTPDALAAVDFVWAALDRLKLTNGKEKPPVKCFRKIMNAGSQTLGYCKFGDGVYFNTDIAGEASVAGGTAALSHQLVATAVEELAHWVSQSTDCSRDLQDLVFNLAAYLIRGQ